MQNTTYYKDDEKESILSFSSLTKLIEQHFYDKKPTPNIQALSDFLWYISLSENETMYQGIYRVPYGKELQSNGELLTCFNDTSIKIDNELSFEQATKRFQDIFDKSVKKLINPNELTGCQLSGGYDSSSVYCVASKYTSNLVSLSMKFEHNSCDESQYINDVLTKCNQQGMKHFEFDCTSLDYKKIYNMESNYDLMPHWPIWVTFSMLMPMLDKIKSLQINTVLTGQLGDHTMAGNYQSIINHLYRGNIQQFISELNYLNTPSKYLKNHIKQRAKELLGDGGWLLLKKILHKQDNNLTTNVFGETPPPLSYKEAIEGKKFKWADQQRIIHSLTSALFQMGQYSNFSPAVKEKYGINFVSPFADRELIEFMLSVPPEYRYSLGNRRYFHGQSMKSILPDSIINRRDKAEFGIIVRQQIDAIDADKLWVDPVIEKMGLMKRKTILAHVDAYKTGQIKPQDFNRYWRMINIEYWYALNPYLDKSKYPPNPYILDSL
jgi:asparagine synthase (glutamine-hydrolysing)